MSEERLSHALDAGAFGLFDWDIRQDQAVCTDRYFEIFGLPPGDSMPSEADWLSRVHPADRDRAKQEIVDVIERGAPYDTEYRVVWPDGSEHWVSSQGNVFRDEGGTPFRMIGAMADITERKRAEEALRKSEESLKTAQKIAQMGNWEYDIVSDRIEWSDGMYHIYGIDPSEKQFTVEMLQELMHPDFREYHLDYAKRLDSEGRAEFEFKLIRPDGETRWVWGQGETIYDKDGNPVSRFGFAQDITDRKRAETEKAKLEAQLHEAQKMESIGRLAGGVAHDFNNMLTAIVGFSDLVQDSLDKRDPLKKDVHQIQKAADSATSLTQQLLAFSRKQIISPKVLNLNKAIAVSEKMIRRLIGEDIDLVFVPDKNLGRVKIDPGQVDQILVNLAVNARDAMPNSGKLTFETQNASMNGIICHVCSKPMNGMFVLMAVSDNGTGIDETTLKNIFEPFFTTKEKGKGTGLGLSTIHGIVLQNNGHINVYSEPGKGTTFKIYFPLVEKESEVPDPIMETSDLRGSETILLVEDMEIVRKLAKRTLTAKGYKIIEAEHGKVALTKFSEFTEKIDLLVTDVIMPQMSGKELFQNLEKLNPKLKVLYMSGFTENAIAHHGVLEEGTNFIQKPFRPADLARKVREVLMQDK